MTFKNIEESHNHSLETLRLLGQYEDFMLSIKTVLDLGCGLGDDLIWWATATTNEDYPKPLNIECTGVDLIDSLPATKKYKNINYQTGDFEKADVAESKKFDILWCHDAFQYAQSPIKTLSNWWHLATPGAMLYLAVPVTQRIRHNQLEYHLPSGCYYHHTMVSLMYMLATAGWDCGSGFFKQTPQDPWIHAVVYKSEHEPQDPKTTTWHTLVERKLLPESAERSIFAHNCLHQQDLILPWLDHSLMSMASR